MSGEGFMSYEQVANYLGVDATRVSEYANYGLLTRHYSRDAYGQRRVYFAEDEVLAFDEKYPAGPDGRRRLGIHDLIAPCIRRRRKADGSYSYYLSMTINGKSFNRTYKSKQYAEIARDRERAKADAEFEQSEPNVLPAYSTNGSSTGLIHKIVRRMNRTPWAGEK